MTSRLNFIFAIGGSLAALSAGTFAAAALAGPPTPVADLIAISERSNAALMQGDSDTWARLVNVDHRFTLMSPFGGEPSRGPEYTPERIRRMGNFFRNGRFKMEMVESYASADMVVLALIERANVEVGDLPAQDWDLRVTLVYQRVGSDWHLVHRHADPLVAAVPLSQAAELARGERLEEAAP